MANIVGIEVELVQTILTQLDQEITDLTDLIAEVGTVGNSIEQDWTSNAANSFKESMQDCVDKTNQTIPVLESLREWVSTTAKAYAEMDEEISGLFKGYIN